MFVVVLCLLPGVFAVTRYSNCRGGCNDLIGCLMLVVIVVVIYLVDSFEG